MPALVVVATAVTACGDTPSDDRAQAAASSSASGPADELRRIGEPIEVGGLRVRVDVTEVGSDEDGPWLLARVQVENLGRTSVALPSLSLVCAEPTTNGYSVNDATSVGPGRTVSRDVHLLITDTGRSEEEYFDPIPPCGDTASISVWTTTGQPDYTESESAGWQLAAASLAELNATLPFTRPGGEPKDPDRPYAWVDGDRLGEGYQVVSVPGMTAVEALRIIDPIREVTSSDELRGVVIDELDGGVVLFTYWLIPDRYLRELSRGGIVASFGNTVNGDYHILVARDGKVVRSFDPFMDEDYMPSKPLPEEEGLDLEYDTGPASWALLERLTSMHLSPDWLDQDRPTYLLAD